MKKKYQFARMNSQILFRCGGGQQAGFNQNTLVRAIAIPTGQISKPLDDSKLGVLKVSQARFCFANMVPGERKSKTFTSAGDQKRS